MSAVKKVQSRKIKKFFHLVLTVIVFTAVMYIGSLTLIRVQDDDDVDGLKKKNRSGENLLRVIPVLLYYFSIRDLPFLWGLFLLANYIWFHVYNAVHDLIDSFKSKKDEKQVALFNVVFVSMKIKYR